MFTLLIAKKKRHMQTKDKQIVTVVRLFNLECIY